MRFQTDAIGLTALILVLLAYVLFGSVFLFRKRNPQTEENKRAPAATFGIVLQGVSFALVWTARRQRWRRQLLSWPMRAACLASARYRPSVNNGPMRHASSKDMN